MSGMSELGAASFIDVDGVRIRYLCSAGNPDATALLLLSPFPESLYAYDDIWSDLSATAPMLAVDLPGFGQSQGRADLMASEAMGTFVTQVLDTLGLQRVHAIGPDVATSALLFAAEQRPTLFESLIVGSGAIDVDRTGSIRDIILANSIDRFAPSEGADYAVNVLTHRAHRQPSDFVLDDYRTSYSGPRAGQAMAYLHAYKTQLPLLQAKLHAINTPVLSIWGAHDPIVLPASAEVLDSALPHTRSATLDSGHFVWHDRPTEYAQLIGGWIDGDYRTV
jgi:pimeloyl-ACP methyl ester carboxylesterase